MEKKTVLERFILSELNSTRSSLAKDEDLLESGIVDSVSLVQLVGFIEQEFSVTIHPDELVPDNFCNIDAITQFVERKKIQ